MSRRHIPRRAGWKVIDGMMCELVLHRQPLIRFARRRHGHVRLRTTPHPLSIVAVQARAAERAAESERAGAGAVA